MFFQSVRSKIANSLRSRLPLSNSTCSGEYVVRAINCWWTVTEKIEKGEAKQNTRNNISTLLNSFWFNVSLKFNTSYILATPVETSQLTCFKSQLSGFYMNCQNAECKDYAAALEMIKLCEMSKSSFCIFWFHYQIVFRGACTTKLRI